MNNTKIFVATLVAGIALFAAGCGGGDDSTTDSGASGASGASGVSGAAPDKAAFIKQADAICSAGDDKIEAAQKSLGLSGQPSTAEAAKFATDTIVPTIQDELDQLSDLTPPEGDEEQVDAVISAAQDGLDAVEKDPASIIDGKQFTDANKLADAYGFQSCGG